MQNAAGETADLVTVQSDHGVYRPRWPRRLAGTIMELSCAPWRLIATATGLDLCVSTRIADDDVAQVRRPPEVLPGSARREQDCDGTRPTGSHEVASRPPPGKLGGRHVNAMACSRSQVGSGHQAAVPHSSACQSGDRTAWEHGTLADKDHDGAGAYSGPCHLGLPLRQIGRKLSPAVRTGRLSDGLACRNLVCVQTRS